MQVARSDCGGSFGFDDATGGIACFSGASSPQLGEEYESDAIFLNFSGNRESAIGGYSHRGF